MEHVPSKFMAKKSIAHSAEHKCFGTVSIANVSPAAYLEILGMSIDLESVRSPKHRVSLKQTFCRTPPLLAGPRADVR
jgi:hypothetical protein